MSTELWIDSAGRADLNTQHYPAEKPSAAEVTHVDRYRRTRCEPASVDPWAPADTTNGDAK